MRAGQTDVVGGWATRMAAPPRPPGSRKVVGTAQSTLIRPVRQQLQKSKVVPHNRFKKTNTASFCGRGQGGVAVSSQIWFWAFLRSQRKEKRQVSVLRPSMAKHGKKECCSLSEGWLGGNRGKGTRKLSSLRRGAGEIEGRSAAP